MAGPDSFYTPPSLAEKLAGYVTAKKVQSAIDFCVGDGDLLKAVAKRFDRARLYGTDISSEALQKLGDSCQEMMLGECDFKNDKSVNNVHFLHDNTFDLIVLNPPFTCKGSVVEHLEFDGEDFKVSTAMLFTMRALRYLSEQGGLYAILPISCVYSEKDKKAWDYLKAHYNACVLEEPSRVYFKDCAPHIVLIYAGRYPMEILHATEEVDFSALPVTSIVRGCVRMQSPAYSKKRDAVPLIHTTNIQKGKLVNLKKILPGEHLKIDGFGVVIPRVCNPNPNKVALLDGSHSYVLSDCVIVLRTDTMEAAEKVRNHILTNWHGFITLYKGTAAQYTTLARVKQLFGKC